MDTVQHTLNILLDFFFFFGLELSGNNGRAAPKSTTRHAWHVNVHTFSLSFHHLLHSNHHHQPTQSAAIPSRRTLIIPETTHSFIHSFYFILSPIHPSARHHWHAHQFQFGRSADSGLGVDGQAVILRSQRMWVARARVHGPTNCC